MKALQDWKILFPVLWPLSLLYGLVVRIRNFCFDRGLLSVTKVALPVISVGNVHAGGTGKTPVVCGLCQQLQALGYLPVVLMRGVGRQSTTVLQVSSDSHWREVGDEALEIVHTTGVPVVVARSRVAGAQYVVNQNLGNVIVLDDGFQHRWLHRDLDVVLIPGEHDRLSSDLFRHRLLPLGLLREPVAAAVRRTNVVLVTRRITLKDSVATDALERVLDRTIDGEVLLTPRLPLASHDAKTCVAYCGIGRPEHFFAFLESQGLVIRQKLTLADHAVPSEQELRELAASGQVILTTVKDWMKLSADWREKVLSVSLAASPDALPLLLSVLKKFLAKARRIDSEL